MKNLEGKNILVCGGATGIGAATVRALTEAGAAVVIGDINLAGASKLAADLGEQGALVHACEYDQAEEASIVALVNFSLERLGELHGLFANVADLKTIFEDTNVLENSIDTWERSLRVNVTGTALLVKAVLPGMLDQGTGAIVLTSSSASVVGEAERPAYAASKAGINSMARHVASRWGSAGIRCNALAPGLVLTEQIQNNMPQEWQEKMLRSVRSTRHGTPEDIAAAVCFLLSDDGEWVNGQTWHINGGVSYSN